MEWHHSFINDETEQRELLRLAKRSVKKDIKFYLYSAFFVLLAILFLAFAVYTISIFTRESAVFQIQMLIYVIVPLLGAVLAVVFIIQKYRNLTEDRCEAKQMEVIVSENKITVLGLKKKQQENSIISRLLREDPKNQAEQYELEISKTKFYAYDAETGRFRWILGKQDFPDLIIPQGKSLSVFLGKLEELGISRTGFID